MLTWIEKEKEDMYVLATSEKDLAKYARVAGFPDVRTFREAYQINEDVCLIDVPFAIIDDRVFIWKDFLKSEYTIKMITMDVSIVFSNVGRGVAAIEIDNFFHRKSQFFNYARVRYERVTSTVRVDMEIETIEDFDDVQEIFEDALHMAHFKDFEIVLTEELDNAK